MSSKMKTAWDLTRQTFSEWSEDNASRLSAALAYYAIFSLAPLLVIAIAVAAFVLGQRAAEGQVMQQLRGSMGESGAQMVQTMIQNAGRHGGGLVATVLGIIALLFGATGLFIELQQSLNTVWDVRARPDVGIWHMVWQRVLGFLMVLGIGLLLVVLTVISAGISGLSQRLNSVMPGLPILAQAGNFIVSFAVTWLLFALIFKLLPDANVAWKDVWVGSGVTALLFTIGKLLIGLYLGKSGAGSAYGAAGSLVLILLWIYYSAQILFLGAEFTQVYANRYGSRVRPSAQAVPQPGQRPEQSGTRGEPGTPSTPAPPQQEAAQRRESRPQPGEAEVSPEGEHRQKEARGLATWEAGGRPAETLPPESEAMPGEEPSRGRRVAALVVGLLAGRYLLPRQAKRRIIRKKRTPPPPPASAWGKA